jgi:histidinol-phosphate aminotransferase
MTAPSPRPGILDIQPYKGGNADIEDQSTIINLSANETPLGASPHAVAAVAAAAKTLHRYPDGDSAHLRQALAAHYDLDPERIICSNGSDELISLLTLAYAGPGDEIIYSRHGFLMYPLSAMGCGAIPIAAPETDYVADVDNVLAKVTSRTKIVFLANPNNPTGTYLSGAELQRLRAGLRDDVLLVIDAAYAEYVNRNDYSSGMEMVHDSDNVVMTRTFSKIYGLAGLRVGWAYAPQNVIAVLHRVRGPFNVNVMAQSGAVAALQDAAHTEASRLHNDQWLPWLTRELGDLGLDVLPSVGNFVLARFKDGPDGPKGSVAAAAHLNARSIVPRGMHGYGLPEALRITVGTEAENQAVVAALKDFLGSGDER